MICELERLRAANEPIGQIAGFFVSNQLQNLSVNRQEGFKRKTSKPDLCFFFLKTRTLKSSNDLFFHGDRPERGVRNCNPHFMFLFQCVHNIRSHLIG